MPLVLVLVLQLLLLLQTPGLGAPRAGAARWRQVELHASCCSRLARLAALQVSSPRWPDVGGQPGSGRYRPQGARMVAVNWEPEALAAGAASPEQQQQRRQQQQQQPHLVPHASSSQGSLTAARAAQLLRPDTRCYPPLTWHAECEVARDLAALAAGLAPPTAEQAAK
jgi:hypothetical protein